MLHALMNNKVLSPKRTYCQSDRLISFIRQMQRKCHISRTTVYPVYMILYSDRSCIRILLSSVQLYILCGDEVCPFECMLMGRFVQGGKSGVLSVTENLLIDSKRTLYCRSPSVKIFLTDTSPCATINSVCKKMRTHTVLNGSK
jgi:hypothetical protein